ncbi:hypothetical protein ACS0TY_001782 [Phlomoides rotata]
MVGQLLEHFSRSQPTNSNIFVETSRQQALLQSGYGVSLARVAANRELPVGPRQIGPGYYLDRYKKKGGKTRQEEDFDQILAEIGAAPPVPTSVAHLDVKLQDQPGPEVAADDKEGEEGITESVTSKEKKKKKKKGVASVQLQQKKNWKKQKARRVTKFLSM